jgi:DNA-damage-inducible protein D
MKDEVALVSFENQAVRRLYDEKEEKWYFSVVDVVSVLMGSTNPRDYWFKMKTRVQSEDGVELSTICRQFKMKAPDGKMLETDCADVQGLLRNIQSIPSPKAEPFKQWLAKTGKSVVTNENFLQPPKSHKQIKPSEDSKNETEI